MTQDTVLAVGLLFFLGVFIARVVIKGMKALKDAE